MKNSEIIRANYAAILSAMAECYETVIRSGGRVQETVYIWEDGEIQTLEDVQGGNTFLSPRNMETRKLVRVVTIEAPCFDVWDFAMDPRPEDEAEAAKMEEELIQWYLEEGIKEEMYAKLDAAIEDAEMDEAYR